MTTAAAALGGLVGSAAGAPCRLSLLGGFELTYAAEPLELCGAGQRVLAFLAVHGRNRPLRRSQVAERLWADTPVDQASSSLRSALWRLPRPHGHKLVRSTASELRLDPDIAVDLWAMEQAAAELAAPATEPAGSPTAAEVDPVTALTLDLLPGWQEDWLMIEQESYRQSRMHSLEQMCSLLRAAGQFSSALRAGLTAVHCEPLRESAHRRVIEVHLSEGNQSEALRQYQTYRKLLAEELGLAPSPAIRRLVAPLLGRPLDG